MKSRHLKIKSDSSLLISLRKKVRQELIMKRSYVYKILLIKALVYGGMLAFFYSQILMATNGLLFVSSFVGFGLISVLLGFNFAHDFSHNTVFKSRRLNQSCYLFLFTLLGAHAEGWRDRHVNSHHFAPNVSGYDSDLAISKLIRVIPNSRFYWYHKYQHWYASVLYTTYSLFWVLIKDVILFISKKDKSLKYSYSFIVQKMLYLILLLGVPMYYGVQTIGMVVLGFLLMHLIQSLFLLFTFFMTHHVESSEYPKVSHFGTIQTSWIMNQIKSSNDFHPFSILANFVFGGFNNHIAHHLFPHIHHVFYPKLNRIIYKELMENGVIPNETSFFGGIQSHLCHLKNLSTYKLGYGKC